MFVAKGFPCGKPLLHQCPRIRCRIREPAANLLSICLLSCSSRDLQKLRLLFLLICIRLQRYLFSFTFRHIFAKYLMDSYFFSHLLCILFSFRLLFILQVESVRQRNAQVTVMHLFGIRRTQGIGKTEIVAGIQHHAFQLIRKTDGKAEVY